ncbi:MAG: cytochrome c oxidase subunit II [Chloroflexi bacterium]|nr:cytochrome c oxidase subunit II [Chloroflexota bacterium]
MTRRGRVWRLLAMGWLGGGLLASLAGCTDVFVGGRMTTVDPLTEFGHSIQNIYALVWWLSVIVFVVVEGALIYTLFRFRRRPGQGVPEQLHGNARLEIAWTIAPALVLVMIAVPTVPAIFFSYSSPPDSAQALKVRAVGHQWWFEFQYPELGLVTANELHVQKGQPVYFDLESADIIHSFWFPRMGGKRDMVPNHTNHIWFTPSEAGRFLGQCVEFCGASHANMRMVLYVHEPADFQAWVANQKAPAAVSTSLTGAGHGAQLFVQKGCAGCHAIEGIPAAVGKQGPNLNHFGNRSTVAAGIAENTPENLAAWLRDPPGYKPGSLMPNLHLNEDEIADLVAFLHSLK